MCFPAMVAHFLGKPGERAQQCGQDRTSCRDRTLCRDAGKTLCNLRPHCRRHSSGAPWAVGPQHQDPGHRVHLIPHTNMPWRTPQTLESSREQPVGTGLDGSISTAVATFWKRVWYSSSQVSHWDMPSTTQTQVPTWAESCLFVRPASLSGRGHPWWESSGWQRFRSHQFLRKYLRVVELNITTPSDILTWSLTLRASDLFKSQSI